MADLDAVLESLGGYGKYQMIIYFIICFVCMRGAWHPLVSVFISATPPYQCRQPDNSSLGNWTTKYLDEAQKCHIVENVTNGTVQKTECTEGFMYDLEGVGDTVVNEWNLVCNREYLTPLSTSIFMAGVMVGALFISSIADYFGRRIVMCVCLALEAVVGFGTAFSNSFILFTSLRFLIGGLNQAISLSGYVMMAELFPARYRTRPGIAIEIFWAAGIMVLAGLAYWIQNWRYLQMVISIPPLLLAASYWVIPESLPWLMTKRRFEEVEQVLKKIARLNKKPLAPDVMNQLVHDAESIDLGKRQSEKTAQNSHENPVHLAETGHGSSSSCCKQDENVNGYSSLSTRDVNSVPLAQADSVCQSGMELLGKNSHEKDSRKKVTILHLFTSPKMALYTVIMCYLWVTNSLDYYGISLSTSELAGDPYLNFFLSGLVEVPAYIICTFALEYYGRRFPLAVFQLLGGLSNVITVFIPQTTASGDDLTPYITALAMIGKFGITGSFSIIFLYSAEMFPTSIRNGSVGLSSFSATLGSLCAPYVIYSAKSVPQLPQGIFGALAIVAGLLTLILPETLNRPLPETIKDVEKLDHKIPCKCWCRRRMKSRNLKTTPYCDQKSTNT